MIKKLFALIASGLLLAGVYSAKAQNAALNFDGVDDYITTTLDADADVMPATTWEAWIYPTTNDGNWRMICSMEDGGWDRFIAMNGGQLYVGVSNNGWNPASVSVNEWQHVAVVYTATEVKFYLNGVEYTYGSGEGSHTSNGFFTIGANESGSQTFMGSIDQLHVWDVARTQAEIQKDMRCSFADAQTNLVANYSFNNLGTPNSTNAGITTLSDVSGNAYDGTLFNFALNGNTSNWSDDADQLGALTLSAPAAGCPGSVATLTASCTGATSFIWNIGGQTITTSTLSVSPAVTTTYVAATGNGGCSVVDSVVLSVYSASLSISGPSAICMGSPVTLTASGANTYTWSAGSAMPVDVVSTCNLAIGLRQLSSSYTGPAIRLRRSSDDTEQDFGFVNGELDVAAIAAFLGTDRGYCTAMYDQSGAGGDVIQTTPSQQPLYVANGLNGKPALRTDGNNVQSLFNNVYYSAPFTAIYTARQNGPNRQRMLTSTSNNWLLGWWSGSMDQAYYEGWVSPTGGNPADSNPYVYSGNSDGSSVSEIYQNGVFQYSNNIGVTGPDGIALGAWQNTSEASDGDFTEVFMFSSVLSASDRQLVENSTGAYYGVLNTSIANGASNTFTPSVNTSYYVAGTDGNGCQVTGMINVMVNALPAVNAAISTSTVCAGTADTLSVSGATTYTWSSNAGSATTSTVVVSPTGNSTYTVTGTDGNSCANTATVSVNINALPGVTASANTAAVCPGTTDTLNVSGAVSYVWSSNAGSATTSTVSVSPGSTDTYTVTGTDGNNCANTATVSVTVNSLPNVTASANTAAICTGAADALSAGGATTYTWSSNAGSAVTSTVSVSPTTNDTYTVTGTDVNGCVNTATVSVTVNSLPGVVAGISTATVCSGTADTLNVSGATTYTWSSNAGSAMTSTVSVSPTANDTYTVTGTDGNGCMNTSTVSVNVITCTTGEAQVNNSAFNVYPNPSHGTFTIEAGNFAENTTLVIYNCVGQIAYKQQLSQAAETISVKLAAGIYTLRLQSPQGVTTKHLVIQ